jgi:hypothetical protein
VGTQLSADFRHVTVCADRQYPSSGIVDSGSSFRAGENGLLAKPRDLALKDGEASLGSSPGSGMGVNRTVGWLQALLNVGRRSDRQTTYRASRGADCR